MRSHLLSVECADSVAVRLACVGILPANSKCGRLVAEAPLAFITLERSGPLKGTSKCLIHPHGNGELAVVSGRSRSRSGSIGGFQRLAVARTVVRVPNP